MSREQWRLWAYTFELTAAVASRMRIMEFKKVISLLYLVSQVY
jgi:hypothetical protein